MDMKESVGDFKDLVYGEVEGSLVFVPWQQAQDLAMVWSALGSSSTWGEFRSLIPPKRYEETLALMSDAIDFDSYFEQESQANPSSREEALSAFREIDIGERLPLDDDPFPGYDLPWVADGDYPEWPAQEMLKWMPTVLAREPYGRVEDSVHNGRFLVLDPAREKAILAELAAAGFSCIKDQELVEQACGHGPPVSLHRATPDLLIALKSPNMQVRLSAIDALESMGESAVPALIQALKDSDPAVRSGSASALGHIRPTTSAMIAALIEALRDDSEGVCHSAGYALGAIGPEARAAIPSLIRALRHPSAKVRDGAGWALGHIGPEARDAIPFLVEAQGDPATQWRATWALGKIAPSND